jgi:integrase
LALHGIDAASELRISPRCEFPVFRLSRMFWKFPAHAQSLEHEWLGIIHSMPKANHYKENIMASISERRNKNGTVGWQALVRVKGFPAVARTFDTPEEAAKFSRELEAELRAQSKRQQKEVALVRKANPTQADYNEEELRKTLRLFAASSDSIKRHRTTIPTLLAQVGDVKLGEIKRPWAKAYIEKMRKKKTRTGRPFTYQTLAVHMQIMGRACRWRAEELELPEPSLPFSTKLLPKGWETHRERRLAAHEERAIIGRLRRIAAPSRYHWRLLFRLALETGARLQELIRAEWSEFDIGRKLWAIPAAHTKTKKARAVPLSKAAHRIIRLLHLLASKDSPRVFHPLGNPTTVSAGFHKFVIDAKVADFRFHDLRHEAISRMVLYKRKLSVFEIMAIVGHSTTEMLHRYANLRGDEIAPRMD